MSQRLPDFDRGVTSSKYSIAIDAADLWFQTPEPTQEVVVEVQASEVVRSSEMVMAQQIQSAPQDKLREDYAPRWPQALLLLFFLSIPFLSRTDTLIGEAIRAFARFVYP